MVTMSPYPVAWTTKILDNNITPRLHHMTQDMLPEETVTIHPISHNRLACTNRLWYQYYLVFL